MILYKIRRNSDGLFSSGGRKPTFSLWGKTWFNQGQVDHHFYLLNRCHRPPKETYKGCSLVTYSLEEIKVEDFS